MRGEKAFLKNVEPEDFLDKGSSNLEKIGIAELFVQSTWRMDVADDRKTSPLGHIQRRGAGSPVTFIIT